ncbi:MAG: aminoacetone oxidase family FAD-binding enzyme [Lachnospiraceae bacterium]|nr:aminoacetone oxidase family FAD-binding enzyme [Lachnospiraceae bacterium]
MIYDVVIIGASASGMSAAVAAARKKHTVLLLEANEELGKKIKVTGNGRCNLANSYFDRDCVRSDNRAFLDRFFHEGSYTRVLDFFLSLGLSCVEKNGYYYPHSLEATSVIRAFDAALFSLGVEVLYKRKVKSVVKEDTKFIVDCDDQSYEGRNVILATGGLAYPKGGSDGSGYALAESFGIDLVETKPALVPLLSDASICNTLAGVRYPAKATLKVKGMDIASEEGEVQFTDYGLSGIVIFNLSRMVNRALEKSMGDAVISLDLMPDYSFDELVSHFDYLIMNAGHIKTGDFLECLYPKKLAGVLLEKCGFRYGIKAKSLGVDDIRKLARVSKELEFHITGSKGYDMAQTTAGGISLDEMNDDFSCKKVQGLYAVGELLDVDGKCGGYNLTFAILSGIKAGENIS